LPSIIMLAEVVKPRLLTIFIAIDIMMTGYLFNYFGLYLM